MRCCNEKLSAKKSCEMCLWLLWHSYLIRSLNDNLGYFHYISTRIALTICGNKYVTLQFFFVFKMWVVACMHSFSRWSGKYLIGFMLPGFGNAILSKINVLSGLMGLMLYYRIMFLNIMYTTNPMLLWL